MNSILSYLTFTIPSLLFKQLYFLSPPFPFQFLSPFFSFRRTAALFSSPLSSETNLGIWYLDRSPLFLFFSSPPANLGIWVWRPIWVFGSALKPKFRPIWRQSSGQSGYCGVFSAFSFLCVFFFFFLVEAIMDERVQELLNR
jgi:hypothetical protein